MMFSGPYRLSKVSWTTSAVFTNTCTRAPYRGPWQAESLAREQMLDVLASRIGIDPLEIRRRNVVHRSELPHPLASGLVIEEVSPEETLEQAAAMVGLRSFPSRAGCAPTRRVGTWDSASRST